MDNFLVPILGAILGIIIVVVAFVVVGTLGTIYFLALKNIFKMLFTKPD